RRGNKEASGIPRAQAVVARADGTRAQPKKRACYFQQEGKRSPGRCKDNQVVLWHSVLHSEFFRFARPWHARKYNPRRFIFYNIISPLIFTRPDNFQPNSVSIDSSAAVIYSRGCSIFLLISVTAKIPNMTNKRAPTVLA